MYWKVLLIKILYKTRGQFVVPFRWLAKRLLPGVELLAGSQRMKWQQLYHCLHHVAAKIFLIYIMSLNFATNMEIGSSLLYASIPQLNNTQRFWNNRKPLIKINPDMKQFVFD